MQYINPLKCYDVAGPTPRNSAYVFFDMGFIPYRLLGFADGAQIFQWDYFWFSVMSVPKSISKALATFKQLIKVGLRLLLSMKLIPARLKPVISESFSCDNPRSLRSRFNSAMTFSANISDSLSLITKHNQGLAPILIRNYSYSTA